MDAGDETGTVLPIFAALGVEFDRAAVRDFVPVAGLDPAPADVLAAFDGVVCRVGGRALVRMALRVLLARFVDRLEVTMVRPVNQLSSISWWQPPGLALGQGQAAPVNPMDNAQPKPPPMMPHP